MIYVISQSEKYNTTLIITLIVREAHQAKASPH